MKFLKSYFIRKRLVLTASTSALVMVGAKFLKNMEVVLCKARHSFFSTMTSLTDSAFSSPLFSFSLSFWMLFSTTFSTLGDLDLGFSWGLGDFSGVLDLDFDFRRLVTSASSSELDDEELEVDELDEDPGGAVNNKELSLLIWLLYITSQAILETYRKNCLTTNIIENVLLADTVWPRIVKRSLSLERWSPASVTLTFFLCYFIFWNILYHIIGNISKLNVFISIKDNTVCALIVKRKRLFTGLNVLISATGNLIQNK